MKLLNEWSKTDLETLVAFRGSEVYELLMVLTQSEIKLLESEALAAFPSDAPTQDAWSAGYRQGKVVGMNFVLKEVIEEVIKLIEGRKKEREKVAKSKVK